MTSEEFKGRFDYICSKTSAVNGKEADKLANNRKELLKAFEQQQKTILVLDALNKDLENMLDSLAQILPGSGKRKE